MIRKKIDGVPFYEFEIFQRFSSEMYGAVLTRKTDIKNLDEVYRVIGRDASPFSFFEQKHGTKVHVVKKAPSAAEFRENGARGDALVTKLAGVPLIIRIADCAGILLYDPVERVVANIHAGWKGLAKRVIRETIREMNERFGSRAKNLVAAVGPMIGSCCCEFSDPERELPSHMHPYILDKNMVDLWRAVEGQLGECGVPSDNIENPRTCTACNHEEFFSYRREPEQGRFGTIIMLK